MKKLIILAIVLLGAGVASAQPRKGATTVGGSISFGTTSVGGNSASSFTLAPSVEYFVSDNLSVGGALTFASNVGSSSWNLGLGASYYMPLAKSLYFSVGGTINFGSVNGGTLFGLSVVPALNYYLTEHFSFSFALGGLTVQSTSNGGTSTTTFGLAVSSFNPSIGIGYTF
jgi:hypothetical protein